MSVVLKIDRGVKMVAPCQRYILAVNAVMKMPLVLEMIEHETERATSRDHARTEMLATMGLHPAEAGGLAAPKTGLYEVIE